MRIRERNRVGWGKRSIVMCVYMCVCVFGGWGGATTLSFTWDMLLERRVEREESHSVQDARGSVFLFSAAAR